MPNTKRTPKGHPGQERVKPHHISILLGTYYPDDEDVSFLEQMATNKGRFREEADKTKICQCRPRSQRMQTLYHQLSFRRITTNTIKWLYWLCSAKLCALWMVQAFICANSLTPSLRRSQRWRKIVFVRRLCTFCFLCRNSYFLCQNKRSLNQNSLLHGETSWNRHSILGKPLGVE